MGRGLRIESYDYGCACLNRCRKDVPILGVVLHCGNELLVVFDPGVRKVGRQFRDEIGGLGVGQAKFPFEGSFGFIDVARPARQVETGWLGERKQRVTERGVDSNACVQNHRLGHCPVS
jgi:hypothetical protein